MAFGTPDLLGCGSFGISNHDFIRRPDVKAVLEASERDMDRGRVHQWEDIKLDWICNEKREGKK